MLKLLSPILITSAAGKTYLGKLVSFARVSIIYIGHLYEINAHCVGYKDEMTSSCLTEI